MDPHDSSFGSYTIDNGGVDLTTDLLTWWSPIDKLNYSFVVSVT